MNIKCCRLSALSLAGLWSVVLAAALPAQITSIGLVGGYTSPSDLVTLGDRIVFAANDGTRGFEPWVTDGTVAGTRILRDIFSGSSSAIWNGDAQYVRTTEFAAVRHRGLAWFFADSGVGSAELWSTDGTPAGTVMVHAFDVPISSYYQGWQMRGAIAGGELLFLAHTQASGWGIWRTDVVTGGVQLVFDLQTNVDYRNSNAIAAGNRVFFVVDNFLGVRLYASDGTGAGTSFVAGMGSSGSYHTVAVLGDRVVFGSENASGTELWVSDGTLAGTSMVMDINPGPGSSTPVMGASLGHEVMFAADDGAHGIEPWITDGTLAGTRLLADLVPGNGSSNPFEFAAQQHRGWIATRSAVEDLWLTDGTTAGTVHVATMPATNTSMSLSPVGTRFLMFRGSSQPGAFQPWITDGTAAGTVPLPSTVSATSPSTAVVMRGAAYFVARPFASLLCRWVPGATSQLAGEGLGFSGPAPRLYATDPVLGAAMVFDGEAKPNAPGLLAISTPAAPIGTLFGAELWIDLPPLLQQWLATDAQGRWSLPPVVVPNLPVLQGLQLAAQSAFANGSLIELSNGVLLSPGQ